MSRGDKATVDAMPIQTPAPLPDDTVREAQRRCAQQVARTEGGPADLALLLDVLGLLPTTEGDR